MELEISQENKDKAEQLKAEGNELFKAKEYIQAIKKYSEAIDLNPQEAAYYSNRANAHQQLRNFKDSLQDCNKALQYDPKFIKVMRRRALVLQQLGQFLDADIQFGEAMKVNPKDGTIKTEQIQNKQLMDQYERAQNYVNEEKNSDAIMEINQILNKVPYWQKIQMLQAEVTAKMGNVERAQQILQQFKSGWDDPSGPDVYYIQGLIYLYSGRSEQAKKVFTAGMQKDPDNKKCMQALKKTRKCENLKDEGNTCLKSKDFDGALAKYDEAIALDPSNKQLNAVIYANKASVYLQQAKYSEARDQCDKSIELNENYPKSYFRRAEARMKIEEFEGAIHDYTKFQELDPSQDMRAQIKQAKVELKKSKNKDYYKILGVAKDADARTIKKAYHKLALQYHPDRVKEEDKKDAEKKFKEINEAFSILSDPKKKEMVDNGIDPNEQGGGGGGMDPNDIFASFFGGGGGGGFPGGGFPGGGGGGFTFRFG